VEKATSARLILVLPETRRGGSSGKKPICGDGNFGACLPSMDNQRGKIGVGSPVWLLLESLEHFPLLNLASAGPFTVSGLSTGLMNAFDSVIDPTPKSPMYSNSQTSMQICKRRSSPFLNRI
jgi:hypothetical protein